MVCADGNVESVEVKWQDTTSWYSDTTVEQTVQQWQQTVQQTDVSDVLSDSCLEQSNRFKHWRKDLRKSK